MQCGRTFFTFSTRSKNFKLASVITSWSIRSSNWLSFIGECLIAYALHSRYSEYRVHGVQQQAKQVTMPTKIWWVRLVRASSLAVSWICPAFNSPLSFVWYSFPRRFDNQNPIWAYRIKVTIRGVRNWPIATKME